MFDIIAHPTEKKERVVVIDVATSPQELISEEPVIALFAKIYDVSPERACLIAIPKMNENGKKLANLYKIKLVEAKDEKNVIQELDVCVKNFAS
jgi:hypothetical protein